MMNIFRARYALLVLVLLVGALAVACGGGDDDDDADDGANGGAVATQPSGGDGGDDPDDGDRSDNGNGSGFDFGDGLVVVTIGNDRYEFDLNEGFNICRDVFGGLQFGGSNEDGSVRVSGWIPPENWESFDDDRYDPPEIEVDVEATNSQWVADVRRAEERGYEPGTSQVDSYQIDGLRASGSATFLDSFAIGETEPVQGTFEIACVEE